MPYEFLKAGDYARGLELFENRHTRHTAPPRQLRFPEWRGEPLGGKTILVWGEQGLGDEIQMVRFVRGLRERGAATILLACHPLNVRAFAGVGADLVFGRLGKMKLPDYDYWVGMLSLPYLLEVRPETMSGRPYLSRVGQPAGGVGLVWKGESRNPNNSNRSLPNSALLEAIPGGIFLEAKGDMLDSIAQLSTLNALVTVCTSWAHLGGALGIPTLVMLCHNADWRWGLENRTPWYRSVQIFRQKSPGEWKSVVDDVLLALKSPIE
jgi:hypothetical protein